MTLAPFDGPRHALPPLYARWVEGLLAGYPRQLCDLGILAQA